tara:strand:+ start:196 stop:315 length:120 start_codon:yes stop_codon:yes gene_type:complete
MLVSYQIINVADTDKAFARETKRWDASGDRQHTTGGLNG